MSPPAIEPAPQKRNLLWWILGLAGVALVLLVVGGLLMASLFIREVRHVGKRVEVSTPAGEIRVTKDVARQIGLPVYPGATLAESNGALEFTTSDEETVGLTSVRYRTADSIDKVDAWYRANLGPEFEREGPGSKRAKVNGHGFKVEKDDIAFVSDRDDLVRVLAIKKRGAGAEIALLRIGKKEPQ